MPETAGVTINPNADGSIGVKVQTAQQQAAKLAEAAMQKAQADPAATAVGASAPYTLSGDSVPEKFRGKDVSELLKSYGELEKKLSTMTAPKSPEQSAPQSNGQLAKPVSLENPDGIPEPKQTSNQLLFEAYTTEIRENGTLSKESREAVEKQLPKAFHPLIDDHIRLIQMQTQNARAMAYSEAGGEEQFKTMAAWAKENMTATERDVANQLLQSGSIDHVQLGMELLRGRYEAANSQTGVRAEVPPPPLMGVASQQAGGLQGFKSMAEQVAAQKDPRYNYDPAYRQEVLKRVQLSMQKY